jgi:hypothetical protein
VLDHYSPFCVQAKIIKLVGLKNGGRLSPINLVTFAGTQNGVYRYYIEKSTKTAVKIYHRHDFLTKIVALEPIWPTLAYKFLSPKI